MIFAVDFDNTLSLDNYPSTGEPTGGHLVVRILQSKGHECFLYTCRQDGPLCTALNWCTAHGIPMRSVSTETWKHGGKEYFDACIDDRNLGAPLYHAPGYDFVDWCVIVDQLLTRDIITIDEYHWLYPQIRQCQYDIVNAKQ